MKLKVDGIENILNVGEDEVALVFTADGLYAYVPDNYDPRINEPPPNIPKHIALGLMAMFVIEEQAVLAEMTIEEAMEYSREKIGAAFSPSKEKEDKKLEDAIYAIISKVGAQIGEV